MNKLLMLKSASFIAMLLLSQLVMAKAIGTVTFAAGDVTIAHADKTVTKAAKNAELNAGDAIETKEGRVQLSMIDGGKISLQPNTIYKINQFEFTGKEDGSEFNFTELVKGGLRTISGLIGHKNRDHYQLKTAVATIGIRGTEFTVNFNDYNLLMTTNHGSVDVCNVSGCLNAITGQTIEVTGIGGAPKLSNKAAKAAAAPPASIKAVFAAGESVDVAALDRNLASSSGTHSPVGVDRNTIVSLTTMASGDNGDSIDVAGLDTNLASNSGAQSPVGVGGDTIVSLATMASGSDNNSVDQGTSTFKGNSGAGNPNSGNSPNGNALKQFTDNSDTTNIVTGTTLEATNDGIVRWGSASGGTYNSAIMLMSNWITGIATPTAGLNNLVATYNFPSSTKPYLVNGDSVIVGATNSVTGSMYVNFTKLNWGYNLIIPVPGQAYTITVANNIAGIGGSALTAGSATFNDSTGITSFDSPACASGCSGLLAGGASVQGSLFGANAERAGLQYGIQLPGSGVPGSGGNLYGGAVFTKQ